MRGIAGQRDRRDAPDGRVPYAAAIKPLPGSAMHLSAQRRRFTPLRYFGVLLFIIAAIVAGGAVWIYASASPADPGGAIVPLAMFGPIVAIVVIVGFLALLGAIFNGLGWFQGGGVDAAPRDSIHDDDWRPYRPPPR